MNLLLLNWRDPKNPKSGGAEKLNLHILKSVLERGYSVTWYSMSVHGLPKKEIYQGIKIIRFGNQITHLLLWPILYWTGKLGRPDIIIDSIHGTGYLSSVVAPNRKKIILICEVAQNIWNEMYSFPINVVGKIWERCMFRFYGKNIFWTISESTRKDLIDFGVQEKNIQVIPMGFDGIDMKIMPGKYNEPTALFVGRLSAMKGIEDAITAIEAVNKSSEKKWRLHIVGRGEAMYEQQLHDLIKSLNLKAYVKLLGFVNEKEKFKEMARSWVLLVPSSREGWGMIVPEANSVGTPAIGYDVPGLRDVLVTSAKGNIKISPSYESISNELSKIQFPEKIANALVPGWNELYAFVRNRL